MSNDQGLLSWQIPQTAKPISDLGEVFYDGLFHTYGSAGFVVKLPDGSRLLIDSDGAVSVSAAAGADPDRFASVIQTTLFAARSWYQRRIPFEASAVLIGDKVLLLGGGSETKRDALALQFASRGYAVSDAMIAVDPETLLIHTNGAPLVLPVGLARKSGRAEKPIFSGADHYLTSFPAPDSATGYPCLGWIEKIKNQRLHPQDRSAALNGLRPVTALGLLSNRVFLKGMAAMLMPSGEYYRKRLRLSRDCNLHSLTYCGYTEIGPKTLDQVLPEILSWQQSQGAAQ